MKNIEAIKEEIISCLSPIEPKHVILFGSYAYGTPNDDSDIDLYVVTKDNFIPKSYSEKRQLIRKVSQALLELRMKVGVDLLVHTNSMNEKFYKLQSGFAQEIKEKGIRLI